jgi:alpha-L-rhamnosidase
MYHVLSVASYYLYSGDIDFAQAQYQIIKNQLAYNRSLVDPSLGLLITGAGGEGRDWDFYDGGKPGAVTAYNAIYYKALTDAAYLARELAERKPSDPAAATWQADAETWSAQAAALKEKINTTLFDPARGVYRLADRDNQNHAGTRCRRTPTRRRSCSGSRPRAPTRASSATCARASGASSGRSRSHPRRTTRPSSARS